MNLLLISNSTNAGANVACPTIRTTNDMPIIDPFGFYACNCVPFQINPHYLDEHPEGHAGETREQRILEFIGPRPARIFRKNDTPFEVYAGGDLSFLMEQ